MNNLLTHYRVSFDVPLQEVSTRELYDACRRLMRMIRRARNQISDFCEDGYHIATAIIQPYYSMMYLLEDELFARRKEFSNASKLGFCARLHDEPLYYEYMTVYQWLVMTFSHDVKMRIHKIRNSKSVNLVSLLTVLGYGLLRDQMRAGINRHAVDGLPF